MNLLSIRKTRRGFTLLELLVVISIIAILITISTVSFTTAQKKGRNSRRRSDMRAVQNAFEQYYSMNGGYTNSCAAMASTLGAGLPSDPRNLDPQIYAYSCPDEATYCACANLEAETGNSDSASCTYAGGGTKSYFCVSQLQ